MAAMREEESDLASQCMAFCQALASKGQTFSFTLNVGPSFTFSLDTRGDGSSKEEIPGGEQSSWPRSMVLHLRKNLLPWKQPLKRRLNLKRRKFSSVTNVRTTSNLKTAWRSTLVKHTRKWTQPLQHLNVQDNSRGVQWASPPLPSWTPACRSPPSTQMSWSRIWVPRKVFPNTPAPRSYVVGISAQTRQKNRRGIIKKCKSSLKRVLFSVNKVQTCMMSYELL